MKRNKLNIAVAFAGLIAGSAIAQTGEFASYEELTVTAQKREEPLQSVGLSVTAFSGEEIESLGWINSLDIAAQTPGLVATSNTGDNANIALFSIRGVNQGDFAEGQEAPVAIYNDEAYLSSPGASGTPAFDLERIEVLRGPQGTLYGRNATGGLVHFISNKPTEDFEAYATLTLAEFGQQGLTTAVSGPLTRSIKGRLAAYYNKDDGYVENLIGPNYRADDTVSARGMLEFDFGAGANLLLIGRATEIDTRGGVYHNRATKSTENGPVFCQAGDTDCGVGLTRDENGQPIIGDQNFFDLIPGRPPGGLFDPANGILDDGIGDEHAGAFDFDGGVDRSSSSLTAIFKKSLGEKVELVSVTDFSYSDKEYREDDDSSQFNLVTYTATAEVSQWSQELRLSGESEKLLWIAGLYYLGIENDFSGAFQFPSDDYFPKFFADSETATASAFGQIDYNLTKSLVLTAGLRYTEDEKTLAYVLTGENALNPDAPNSLISGNVFEFDRTDGEFSGKLQLDWHLSGSQLFYLGYNRGIKGGGFNTPSDGNAEGTFEAIGFDPEILNSFEFGSKTTFANGKGRLNAGVFHYDYENYQAFFFSGTTSLLINSEATFQGGELELSYATENSWDFIFGLAALSTEVNGVANDGNLVNGNEPPVIENQQALLAPELSANLLVRKAWDIGLHTVSAQVSVNHVGEQFFNLINSEATAAGDYTLTNFRLSYLSERDTWEASVFVNNLTDERPVTYGYDISDFGKYSIYVVGPPRWAGIQLKYKI